MRPSHLSLAAATATLCAVALFAGCSGNDSSSPTVTPPTGPTFNFTFPQTGTSQQLTINDVGTWTYCCQPHGCGGGSMTGTIIVAAGSGVDSQVVIVGRDAGNTTNVNQFSPSTVNLKAGGYIRWVNGSTSTFNHTATR